MENVESIDQGSIFNHEKKSEKGNKKSTSITLF